ncbi:mesenchyme-specific cell surface glycoprotein [Plakobranchus ocellatus]|uniref:Mesenchyme-specific cell surface glycoprotein n=1 Tax=Plakobranchus ocellatus TaxID=259542 RepID=A0AAV4DLL1_9GAST|nr:mesenchyme-specific cell surface glycoprotein [Plakobranchus ocellatus]
MLHVISVAEPAEPEVKLSKFESDMEFAGIAGCNDLVFVTVRNMVDRGKGQFRVYSGYVQGFQLLAKHEVGANPGDVIVREDCKSAVVSLEGEPYVDGAGSVVDPEGEVLIAKFPEGVTDNGTVKIMRIDFGHINDRSSVTCKGRMNTTTLAYSYSYSADQIRSRSTGPLKPQPSYLATILQTYSSPSLPATQQPCMLSLHCLPNPPSMLPALYDANLWSTFIACHNHHPCSLASTLPTYSQPSLPATTTIRAPWPLLCHLKLSLHCLQQPSSILSGLYSANLWSAFNNCHNHHPCSLASTLPTYGQTSLPATTIIRAPWPLLCQLIVSLHCLPQQPSVRPGLYSATLNSAFIACNHHHPSSLASTLPTYSQTH